MSYCILTVGILIYQNTLISTAADWLQALIKWKCINSPIWEDSLDKTPLERDWPWMDPYSVAIGKQVFIFLYILSMLVLRPECYKASPGYVKEIIMWSPRNYNNQPEWLKSWYCWEMTGNGGRQMNIKNRLWFNALERWKWYSMQDKWSANIVLWHIIYQQNKQQWSHLKLPMGYCVCKITCKLETKGKNWGFIISMLF